MVQIFENKRPSIGERFSQGISRTLDAGSQIISKKANREKEFEAYKQLGLNPEISNLPDEAKFAYFKNAFTSNEEKAGDQAKRLLNEEKLNALKENQKSFQNLIGNDDEIFDNDTKEIYPKNKKLNNDFENLSDDKLKKLATFKGQPGTKGNFGNLAQSVLDSREKKEDAESKRFESDRKYHSEVSRPIVKKANETIESYNTSKGVRSQLRRDIQSGETSGMLPFIVDKLGLESFRNPESARFTNEVKNLFVDALNDIPGARPNQFIERFLSTAQPMIGRSVDANLSVLDVGDFIEEVKLEQAKQELQIAKEDREKFGYVKEDVSERARDRLGDFVNKKQEEMALNIRKRQEDQLDNSDILNEIIGKKIAPGTYVTPRTMKLFNIKHNNNINKAVEEIKSLGMVLPEFTY